MEGDPFSASASTSSLAILASIFPQDSAFSLILCYGAKPSLTQEDDLRFSNNISIFYVTLVRMVLMVVQLALHNIVYTYKISKIMFMQEGQIELLESKQDVTNSGLWYLCQAAGGIKDGDVGPKLIDHSSVAYEDKSPKGFLSIAETNEQ